MRYRYGQDSTTTHAWRQDHPSTYRVFLLHKHAICINSESVSGCASLGYSLKDCSLNENSSSCHETTLWLAMAIPYARVNCAHGLYTHITLQFTTLSHLKSNSLAGWLDVDRALLFFLSAFLPLLQGVHVDHACILRFRSACRHTRMSVKSSCMG